MIIAIDFDGTCVTHKFPEIGEDIGAIPVLKKLVENNNKLILHTVRSDSEEKLYLSEAVEWFVKNGIELWGVNNNPQQHTWSDSKKTYAHIYIDDAALGCPLVYPNKGKPYVDWNDVEKVLKIKGLI